MKLIPRTLLKVMLALTLLSGFSVSLNAQPARYLDGTHYVTLPAAVRTTSAPGEVEVMEVFWYGCSHCYSFEPLIENWEANLPEDVKFVRSPGMWNDMMQVHARLYYTAVALGVFDQVHNAIYDQIQLRGNLLRTEDAARAFFVSHGVAPEEFNSTWNSFSVTSDVNRANNRMRDFGIRGTPTMVVAGKYRVSVSDAVPTHADMLEVVNYLVEMERNG